MASLKEWGYQDLKIIGRGQYGKAHLVLKESDQTRYIAKTIDLTCLSKKEHETAQQEVDLLRRLEHPNIVEYKDNFFTGDTLVIVMMYCEGGDLATYIKDMARKKQRIQEKQVMHYFVQVLQALQHIHNERILHRDLKTSNLFLTNQYRIVKLGDFGISRVLEGSIEAAITVVGTPYYMSPEVCENKPYTFKSDVWSLGCVLYELCMLKHAFQADNLLGLVYKIVSDDYEAIPKFYSKGPLNNLIQQMLEKNADKRPSVRDLLAHKDIQEYMTEYVRTRGQCATPMTGAGRGRGSGGAGRGEDGARGPGRGAGRGRGGAAKAPAAKTAAPAAAREAKPHETPKEAAARRKREAADKEGAKLRDAARQGAQNRTIARNMKEREFQGTSSPAAAPRSPAAFEDSAPADEPAGDDPEYDYDEDYSGDDSEDDDFDSYSSDFEEEEEGDPEDDGGEEAPGAHRALSMVREEQDEGRVFLNYEQDLARGGEDGDAPRDRRAKASAADEAPAQAAPPPPQGAVMDVQKRAARIREDCIRKMGEDTFQKAFAYLLDARARNEKENTVKRTLEQMIGREQYRACGMDVDQLVFMRQSSGC